MRRLITLAALTAMLITGCADGQIIPPQKEIGDLSLIRVIAVDKSLDTDKIKVTVTSQRLRAGGGGNENEGDGADQIIVLSEEDETVQGALKRFETYTNKRVFWGHAEVYLIGEEAAKDNIVKYLDFLTRDHDFRLSATVYIIFGKAGDMVERSNLPNFFIADYLTKLVKDMRLISFSGSKKALDLIDELDENNLFGVTIPTLLLDGELIKTKGKEEPLKEAIKCEGYAIIKNFKLVGFLDPPYSRGYNIITNNFHEGGYVLHDQNKKHVGIDVLGAKTKIVPDVEGGKLKGVRVITKLEGNIDEVQSQQNIFKEESLEYLESQLEEAVRNEMDKCVSISKDLNADFLGIGKAIHLKHPVLWERIKDEWNEIFANLNITIEVEIRINRTYDIKEPTGYKAGGTY